jgi:hypothetical protein
MRQCKDFSKLEQWAFSTERNACWTKDPTNTDSVYYGSWRRCPPNSPYFQAMRKHFGYDDDWKIDYELHKDLDGPAVSWDYE